MAKNVCPRCKEVIIGFVDEESIKCSKCDTVFETESDDDGTWDIDENK